MAIDVEPAAVAEDEESKPFRPGLPSEDVVVDGEKFRRRSPLGVWLLSLSTLGVYAMVWHYKVNDEARRYLRDPEISPGLSFLAFSSAGLTVVPVGLYLLFSRPIRLWGVVLWFLAGLPFLIAPLVSVFRTGERIARMQKRDGGESTAAGIVGVLLMPAGLASVPYYQAELNLIWGSTAVVPGLGLVKGLLVTLKHLLSPSVTQQYPHEKPDLPPRTRGVISLKAENCTVCWKCSRECPDWCIYIESHKETHEPASGGRARSAKVLDRFAIDYALCMYCGICVEVCPFDALFWSPEFEYATYGIQELTHEKERLDQWNYTVLPPPELEEGAELPGAEPAESPPTAAAAPAAPAAAAAATSAPAPAPPAPAEEAAGTLAAGERAAPAAPRVREEVEPDQETYDRVLQEELDKGTDRRVAEGRAKSAGIKAARAKKAEGAES
jgi:formate hydrogenlyase subunit 6/NADH:ubiquinone oxidoreductase subunit I